MRVFVGIAEMGIGGAEAVAEELAAHRIRTGDEVTIASAGGFRADQLAAQGVRAVLAPMQTREPAALMRAIRAVRRELTGRPPDLTHVHNVKAAAVVRAAAARRPAPVLATLHGVPDAEYRTAARLLRACSDRLVAVSADVAERVVAAGYPGARTVVIENAIRTPAAHDRGAARDRLGIAPDVPVAVCVARLVDQKRHDLLVSAWRSVPTDALLLVAGDGANRERIAGQIAELGLAERVRMLGARTDVDWLLAAADVSVLPSDWEGLPISILEALAAGVPVVASAVGALPATLAGAAHLVAPRSSEALAQAVTSVLTDAAERERLRAAGLALIASRFGVDAMHAAYDAEYAQLLG
jgi:glycosyltransferase involved in cell wall biosynthesis